MRNDGGGVPLRLGRQMAHRGRSQAVLAQRWSSAGMVGAVGRASVGFGIAVGRSRSIRPAVLLDDLNSAALRPSFDLWRVRHHDADADDATSADPMPERRHAADAVVRRATDVTTAKTSARTAETGRTAAATAAAARTATTTAAMAGTATSSGLVPTSASRASVPASGSSAARRRHWSQQARRSRPTWTDQVIARSSVGYTTPPPTSGPAEPPRPADFVPSGDEKLDRLRLLVQQKAKPDAVATARRTRASDAGVSATAGDASPAGDRVGTGRSRHVGAVPGVLARSMRPESAVAAPPPGSSPRLGGVTPTPGNSTGSRRQTRPAEPPKQDRLKQLLIERGLLPDERPPDAAGTGPAPGDRTDSPSGPTSGASARGSSGPDREVRRSPAPIDRRDPRPTDARDGRRPSSRSEEPGRPGTPGRSAAPRPAPADTTATRATPSGTTPPGTTAHRRTPPGTTPSATTALSTTPSGTTPSGTGPSGTAARAVQTSGAEPATRSQAGTDPAAGLQNGADAGARSSVALADRTPERAAASSQMRLRRLLRSDRVDRDGEPIDNDATVEPVPGGSGGLDSGPRLQLQRVASPSTATGVDEERDLQATQGRQPDKPMAAVAGPIAPAANAAAIAARHRIRAARTPTLPGDLLSRRPGDPVLRRLTLPRATSTTHRPPSVLPAPTRPSATPATPQSIARSAATVVDRHQTPTGRSDPAATRPLDALAASAGSSPARSELAAPHLSPTTPASTIAASAVAAMQRAEPAGRRDAVDAPRASAPGRSIVAPGTGTLAGVVRRATSAPAVVVRVPSEPVTANHRSGTLDAVQRRSGRPTSSPSAPSARTGHGPAPIGTGSAPSAPGAAPTGPGTASTSPGSARTGTDAASTGRTAQTGSGTASTRTPTPTATADAGRASGVADPGSQGEREVATPAEVVAAKFMTALSATVRRRPAPLPTPFRPMADAIAGPRPVMLSTDAASRRALRSVRKVAATTDNTIHLDPTAIPRARLDEVVAHELTHVAHPSPAPRFFDDIDDSPEERRAEQVARVMARSPLAPSSSVVAPSPGTAGGRTIRRTAASPGAHRTSPGPLARSNGGSSSGSSSTVSAAALAARLTSGSTSSGSTSSGSSASSSSGVIHRSLATSPTSTSSFGSDLEGASDPPAPSSGSSHGSSSGAGSPFGSEAEAAAWFDKRLAANVGPLLRMIEDRMRIELERRGGRNWRRS